MQSAQLAYDNGDFENSLSYLRKAASIDGTFETYSLMADCYEATGNYDKAIEAMRMLDTTDTQVSARIRDLEQKKLLIDNAALVTVNGEQHSTSETSLVLDGKGLGNDVLNEITQLYALNNLSLADNNISDISALKSLGGLSTLNLNNNQISNLEPISGLTGLRTLYLDNNPIGDLRALYGLQSLTSLSIKGVEIGEKELESLSEHLPNCAINGANTTKDNELIALGGISFDKSVTDLDLSGRGLSDVSALAECTNLKTLNLSSNQISDITPLMDMPYLSDLNLSANNITDVRPLMGMGSITILNLSGNSISNTVPLGAMTQLGKLDISGNPVSNFAGIRKLKNLTYLNLSNTPLEQKDVEYFKLLTKLANLDITDTPAMTGEAFEMLQETLPKCDISHSDLVYTMNFDGLDISSDSTVLDLSNSGIIDISGVMKLTKLESVNLSGNGIVNINYFEFTESWRTLKRLDLSSNEIKDITALQHLTELEYLNLSDNYISNIGPLYNLQNLRELYLGGNNLTEEQVFDLEKALPNCQIVAG